MVETIIAILVQLVLPLILLLVYVYGKWVANLRMAAKRIDPDDFGRKGDVRREDQIIKVKFLWTVRTAGLGQIKKISGYSDDDFSKETWDEFVMVKIRKSDIIFNASDESHRSFLNRLMQDINAPTINWEKGFQEGTVDKPVILFCNTAEKGNKTAYFL